MLIKQPKGTVNFAIVSGTPCARTVFKVTGRVAAEEAVPQAVIQAGEDFSQNGYGLILVKAKKMMGIKMKRWICGSPLVRTIDNGTITMRLLRMGQVFG